MKYEIYVEFPHLGFEVNELPGSEKINRDVILLNLKNLLIEEFNKNPFNFVKVRVVEE